MDVTKGFIITTKEPNENLQYNKIQQIQDCGVSKIYKIIIQQSHPVVKQTLCDTAVLCTSKPKPVEDEASGRGEIIHSFDCGTVDKSTHYTTHTVCRNKNENSVASGRSSNRKSANPCRLFKYENNKSVIAFPNTLRGDITVAQEDVFSRKSQQHGNHASGVKDAELSIIPSCTSVTEGSMISQDSSKCLVDLNFIKNYWIAAFASNPEYGLYELPPQNGYCCPFCDFVSKNSIGVLSHWKRHAGVQQLSFNYQHIAFLLEQQSSAKIVHNKLHNKLRPNKCHVCQKNFSKLRSLQKHMVHHYESEQFECNVCHKAFFFKKSLDSHVKIHTSSKYKCAHCKKVYTYLIALKRHLRTVHQD